MVIFEYIKKLISGKLFKNSAREQKCKIFHRSGQILLDIIYPEQAYCLNCNQELFSPEITGLCGDCLQQIEFINNFCLQCGRKISKKEDLCPYCYTHQSLFTCARSVAVYDGVFRDLILNYKYNERKELIKSLAHLLELFFYEYYERDAIDYLLAIPLHEKKLEIRGFNQAGLLAEYLSASIDIPLLQDSLLRVKDSPALYNLDQRQRRRVIDGVFEYSSDGYAGLKTVGKDICYNFSENGSEPDNVNLICSPDIKNKNIMLIDDIFTTGTTINEAARVLKNNEAGEIYAFTLATADLT